MARSINKFSPLAGERTLSGLTNPPKLSLYIHIPWCLKKCPYCDFNSHENRQGAIPEAFYVNALIADLEQSTPMIWGRKIHSIFFGGGTPSLFSPEAIDKILSHVRMLTPLEYDAEITLEANPGAVDGAHFSGYKQAGVNRLSLGIQSFNDVHLQALGRIHNRKQAHSAIELALTTFEKVNLDLMYGLPQQTLQQALDDAHIAYEFKPEHLSFYHLTLEPNTPFFRTPPSLPEDDISALMQEEIEQLLHSRGYGHYETSAFAHKGYECQHNLNYWTFGDYLGIGAGAHSKLSFHDKIIRQSRHKHPARYLEFSSKNQTVDSEVILKKSDLSFEFMMNALRLNNGFKTTLFQQRTGLSIDEIATPLKIARNKGLIIFDSTQIKPTLLGQRFLNELLQLFLNE